MRIPLGLFFLFFFSINAFATFLPNNDLWKQDSMASFQSGLTEAQFNKVIDKVSQALEPSVRLHGGNLSVKRLWSNGTVNASSSHLFGQWYVLMYGGLARRPEVTEDGFALVMCHEMGHHLGGFPFYGFMSRWAASEGEADYFATDVCLKKLWADDKVENAKSRFNVDPYVKQKCDTSWKDEDSQNLCYRSANASVSLGRLLQTLKHSGMASSQIPELHFHTPDSTHVQKTNVSYPSNQCRLDTYFAGSLCTANFDLNVIPGRNYFRDQTSPAAEKRATKYSCAPYRGFTEGNRPGCWFKSQVQ